jgi:hypothetical protein
MMQAVAERRGFGVGNCHARVHLETYDPLPVFRVSRRYLFGAVAGRFAPTVAYAIANATVEMKVA